MVCNENMNKDLTLIGENDCHGIEADVLNLKCSFNYFGNINYNLLHLGWIEKYKFNSLEKKLKKQNVLPTRVQMSNAHIIGFMKLQEPWLKIHMQSYLLNT